MENKEEQQTVTLGECIDNMNKEMLYINKYHESDITNKCTYSNGYITQELYSCLTCFNDSNKPAGLCAGCINRCHIDHDVVEMGFKRGFRCDCGNSKICIFVYNLVIPCELDKEKEPENELNDYNHNFEGNYCYCGQKEEGDMIQCFVCEDWYHDQCITLSENNNDEEGELICRKCLVDRFDFILKYKVENFLSLKKENSNIEEVCLGKKRTHEEAFGSEEEAPIKLLKTEYGHVEVEGCKIAHNKTSDFDLTRDVFIDLKKFSEVLCRCKTCKQVYNERNLGFLNTEFYNEWINRVSIEDKLIQEVEKDTDKNVQNIETLDNVDLFQIEDVKNLTVEKVIHIINLANSIKSNDETILSKFYQ